MLSYVAGFLDGKALGGPVLNSGFQGIVQSSLIKSDPEAHLDEFQKNLEAALATEETRFWHIVGGIALIGIGIYLKSGE